MPGRDERSITARSWAALTAVLVAVGFTAQETAAATGSTPGGVRVTQHRALDRLRAHLRTTPR